MTQGNQRAAKRRNAGLCIDCGVVAPEDLRHTKAVAERKARETGFPVARFLHMGRCGACEGKRSTAIAKSKSKKQSASRSRHSIYERRKEGGVCVGCGKAKEELNLLYCRTCRVADSTRAKTLKDSRLARGLCHVCGRERGNKKYKMCEFCRASSRAYKRSQISKVKS